MHNLQEEETRKTEQETEEQKVHENVEKDELEPFRQVNKQLFDFSKEIDTVPISGM